MIIINNLLPVCTLIVMGMLLKCTGMTNSAFHRTADRLIYYIFFPAMLFWKIGKAAASIEFTPQYIYAALSAVMTVYVASAIWIVLMKVSRFQAGSFSQSCYRFNTYIAVAVTANVLGEKGAALLGVLIGVAIPLINVLAVTTLVWYGKNRFSLSKNFRMTLGALGNNPLIIACAAGMLVAHFKIDFPLFWTNTLALTSAATLPLALLSIGAGLSFDAMKQHLPLNLAALFFKIILLPIAGLFYLKLFQVTALPFKVTLLFLAMPTSTAIYVLSSQLNSDTQLAAAAIVVSTIGGLVSLSAVLILLK